MRIAVAIDSLKGSLSSLEAGAAIAEGIKKVYPDAQVDVRPLADGGEGTVEALTIGMGGALENIKVTGPLGESVESQYGILYENKTAIIEMSSAAGLTLLPADKKNPLKTTTYGVGEMILDAINKGCRRFIVGIGGSATNDAGIGMLQALGFGILNEKGSQVPLGAQGLAEVKMITDDNAVKELQECTFKIACDVKNPLFGANGCSFVFGPQKGAAPVMMEQMDQWMKKFSEIVKARYTASDPRQAGAGAAGGLGFAFSAFLNAELEAGIRIVLEETHLEKYIQSADFVVTGEGCLDGQTVMGKAPIGVAGAAKKYGKTVIAFGGCVKKDAVACNQAGIDAFFPILQSAVTLEEAMEPDTAKYNMTACVEQVFRLIKAAGKDFSV